MNPNIINIIMMMLAVMMLFSMADYFISLFFSRIGISVICLIILMYYFYKVFRGRRRAPGSGYTYYDHINTYSTPGQDYEYRSGGRITPGLISRVIGWFRERVRKYHYDRFMAVWQKVQKKYENDMRCPSCSVELTVFNVSSDGRCNCCKNKLV